MYVKLSHQDSDSNSRHFHTLRGTFFFFTGMVPGYFVVITSPNSYTLQ